MSRNGEDQLHFDLYPNPNHDSSSSDDEGSYLEKLCETLGTTEDAVTRLAEQKTGGSISDALRLRGATEKQINEFRGENHETELKVNEIENVGVFGSDFSVGKEKRALGLLAVLFEYSKGRKRVARKKLGETAGRQIMFNGGVDLGTIKEMEQADRQEFEDLYTKPENEEARAEFLKVLKSQLK